MYYLCSENKGVEHSGLSITLDRRQSRTISYLKVIHSRLPKKEFSIANKTFSIAIISILAIENEKLLKILRSRLPPIRCVIGQRLSHNEALT